MLQDFFDALAKGTEELKKKFCDLIDSRDELIAEKEKLQKDNELYQKIRKSQASMIEELNRRIESLSGLHPIYGKSPLEMVINERDELITEKEKVFRLSEAQKKALADTMISAESMRKENLTLQNKLRSSDSCVDALADEVKALTERLKGGDAYYTELHRFYAERGYRILELESALKKAGEDKEYLRLREILNKYKVQPVVSVLGGWASEHVQRQVINLPKQVTYIDLVVENQSLKSKLDKSEATAKGLFEDLSKLQKEKDNGFFVDALKAKDLVDKNRNLEESLQGVIRQRDALDRKVSYGEEVIGQRNSMIAGLQKQIRAFEEMKDTHETYAGVAPGAIPRPHTAIEFFDIRWQRETRIQGIEGKTIHLSGYPFSFDVDTRIPAGMIIIK